LEAISRAQSNWLGYLQQMPVIVEQSNQAIRNQITLMERMSYLQGEVGSSGGTPAFSSDGSGGGGRPPGDNGGSAGGYSTAALAGYQDPFQNMSSGTGGRGGGGGGGPAEQQVREQMQAMQGQDPRMIANMAAARGMAVNPATVGMVGGVVMGALGGMGGGGGGSGQGAPGSGSTSPQPGNAKRTAGGPPDPGKGGQPPDSQGQNEPGEPGDGDPAWRHFTHAVMNEVKAAGGVAAAGGVGGILGRATKIGARMGAGSFFKGAAGRTLLGAGAVGAAGIAANQVQNIGEDITEYQQLGSVRGGDYMTGIGMELENRIRAVDPFVNLPQTREAMQAAYSNGFMGDSVSQVQDQAISNFKELGMSMQETARMMASAMYGKDRTDSGATLEERTKLDAVVRTMKELSADGGLSAPERRAQLERATDELVPGGMDADSVKRGELALQEAYGNTRGLGENVSKIAQNVSNSQTLMAVAGQRVGITGIVPSAMKKAMNEAGYNQADILQIVAKETVQQVSGLTPKLQRVGVFMDLMNQQGAEIPSYEDAEALYDSVADGKDPIGDASKELSKPKRKTPAAIGMIKGANDLAMKAFNLPGKLFGSINDHFTENARETLGMPSREQETTAELFAPTGREASAPPQSAAAMPASVTTDGKVTGNVTITVDQAGRVTAPPSIQLSGLQQSALAGWGASQVNNVSPGDSHSTPPLTGGG